VLDIARGLFLVVADAPLDKYGEAAIAKGLSDLDWVSRAAVAHEAVVESFDAVPALLPFKLFTIFINDERALEHVRGQKARIRAAVKRVSDRQEWSVRVFLDRDRAEAPAVRTSASSSAFTGAAYLTSKKARRDAVRDLAEKARETVAALFDRMAARAGSAKRRTASELPAEGGPLLLDAAFLVPRRRAAAFRKLAANEARELGRRGYRVSLTGPWPPYSFVQD
jgi:hypothetical protein